MTVDVRIEVPRGGFVKWSADGGIDFVSPVPCPFAYGSVVGTVGADSDPLDAVVLGGRHRRGDVVTVEVRGKVRFLDGGTEDDKLVCADGPIRRRQRWGVLGFFRVYAVFKRTVHAARGTFEPTRVLGWQAAASETLAATRPR